MPIQCFDYQLDAISRMKTGCILCGGTGSGKSLTSLAYYYIQQGGSMQTITGGKYIPLDHPKDLYIITTAQKRDKKEWEGELIPFLLSPKPEFNYYENTIEINSWNNIQKYVDVKGAFFIFDEQRVVGYGAWAKAFLKIAANNDWILLSATPGDTWMDYVPVFIANGFFRNKSEFNREHCVWNRYSKFPKVDRFVNTRRLERLRDAILIPMDYKRKADPQHEDVMCSFDYLAYKELMNNRRNKEEDRPIKNAAELCYQLRKIVNSDPSRAARILDIFRNHPRIIVFYNFDYELEILRGLDFGKDVEVAEWNGYKHQPIPECKSWVYLVQYTAGAEGWNCIKTDTIIFYSQNYSYKILEQSCGRIDRLNTPFDILHYYHLKSQSQIDLAISRALAQKKKFNEGKFAGGFEKKGVR